ncbi:ABC transporter substrate-binding protein [Peribacillus psychrosaccharolyticus]|uniref:ABC transporter substrate-binding protein n=1 Tax=Peribacillus psychrosaccharolyticus TaxID=1407 RepID=UPI003D2813A2
MDLDYFHLRALLFSRERENKASLRLSELEPVWNYTNKTIKRKLNKYQEEGLFEYFPGNGRGNQSLICFKSEFQDDLKKMVKTSIQKGKYENILPLLDLNIPKSWLRLVTNDLLKVFGLQSNEKDQEILRSIISRTISTLDPLFTSIAMESFLIQQFSDTLVTYDSESMTVKPCIAHNWRVNEDYTDWTFYLRKGVNFHHQRTLTSQDVLFTLNRFAAENNPNEWLVADIEDIDCPSPFVVTIRLKKSNPFFLRYLCKGNLAILPADVPFNEFHWIGTGPFKMKNRTEESLVLEAFDQYFLERPLLDRVEFWHVNDMAHRGFNLEVAGEKEIEYIENNEIPVGFTFLAFNFHRNPFVRQISFRKAMYLILDSEKMHRDLHREPPQHASSFFAWKSKYEEKHVEEIQSLLKESEYNGEELTLVGLINKREKIEETEWLAREAAVYGVNLKISHVQTFDEFYSKKIEQEADMMMNGEVPSPDYELSFLEAFYNKALIFQRFLKEDDLAYIVAQLNNMCLEPSFSKRDQIRDEIEDYLRSQHAIIFIKHSTKQQFFHSMIKGFVHDSYGYMDLRKIWIKKTPNK